ncbi:peptide chain release factor N(5)-glutamine methyltransferase [Sporosarcina sp. HYO08]|uniref:peptide chain release factor N(5)-glutamine methyltransferase n=1 Tax=Sporosarcina sp. HYO08 TaxID=1759557 RepID=UPI0007962D08|nr:peptide chain release factor N(5)-glutamine methyltransferase [Sporosarcina sp. HYO08]KXH83970.1 protein-(glutamine-N5) methyltransferase, release factor-specific [Sporosarcina sp. HYO08]
MNEKIFEAIKRASALLEEKGLETNMASLLMEFVTKKSSASLLADWREPLTEEQQQQFWSQMHELLSGKPLQYVIGQESFYGRLFKVDANVLIPRPETEELVFEALKRSQLLFHDKAISVVDIGTGSGAIAVSFKKEWPEANVYATDISEGALAIAKQNAEALEAAISFRRGDLTEPIADRKWDVVLSNPPYIAYDEADQMTNSVLEHEPHCALFAKDDGLYFYQQLANTLPPLMNKRSLIGVEIGYQQGKAVHKLFQQAFPNAAVDIVQDINGKDRMIFCKTCE